MGEYEPVKVRRTSAPLPSRQRGLFPLSEKGRYGDGPPPVYVRGPLPEYFRPREDLGSKEKFIAYSESRELFLSYQY